MENKYLIPNEWIVDKRSNFYEIFKLLNNKINNCVKESGEVHTKKMANIIDISSSIIEILQECLDNPLKECTNPDLLKSEIRYTYCISIRANSFVQEYLNGIKMDSIEEQYNEYLKLKNK